MNYVTVTQEKEPSDDLYFIKSVPNAVSAGVFRGVKCVLQGFRQSTVLPAVEC